MAERIDEQDGGGVSPLEAAFGAYLAETAERADRLRAEAARSLVAATQQAAGLGWSQRRIAAALGRSQPEVARLLRRVDLVHTPPGAVVVGESTHGVPPGTGPVPGVEHDSVPPDEPSAAARREPLDESGSMLGRVLGTRREAIVTAVERNRASNVRVFGSVARGEDGPESDVDLLVDPGPEMSLFDLGRLEVELTEILGRPVDVVPARSLRPAVARMVEAIAL